MIKVTRTIEYEYSSIEVALRDVEAWSVGHRWQMFGSHKRARSRVVEVREVPPPPPPGT